ncbi:alpha/beta hydrolase [Vibrio harveyi]|uniref:alpha/beta hydrolase n=1 Tax=Vibrio harveyi TaxID=669 RepID=UPI0006809142|nr:alpha/beta hydrolase-fold protein [Vibrio harveyi]
MEVLKRWFIALSIGVVLSACGGGDGSSVDSSSAYVPAEKIQDNIFSNITGVSYPYDIYLPENYDERTTSLPVIYVSDGNGTGQGFGNLIANAELDVILIAIHEGPPGRRNIDYLPPGVDDFYLFLTQELIPIVEAEYDIDPNERTLAGHSFGGTKTAYIMLTEDIGVEFFKNFIISDGSFWRIDDTIYSLEEQRYEASPWLEATAILSSTNIGNHPSVDAFYKHIQSKGYMGFNLPPLIEYKKLDHGKMWYHTYRDSLPILFPKEEI